jgi:hypothetical protein
VPQGNGIRRSKDLRARFRKFLILTNERKKMSKTTLRKRISVIAASALTAGMLSVVATPVATAHNAVGSSSNTVANVGTTNGSMFVATKANATGAAVVGATGTTALVHTNALSLGLLAKDTSSGTAQTATVLAGGVLSFYAPVSTTSAFTATGGSFASTNGGTVTYSESLKTTVITGPTASSATGVATLWSVPSTTGSYTVSLYVGDGIGNVPTASVPAVSLGAAITVTVVAASTGGTYSAIYSGCNTAHGTTTPTGIDSTATVVNGSSWFIDYALKDGYNQFLSAGNIVATATNGALLSLGTAGSTPAAGTASTVVAYNSTAARTVRIDQPTAGAPLTTTVTITYNGTTVCTKSVTIRGEVAKLTVGSIATQDLSTAVGIAGWLDDGSGRAGLFTVTATDSAGNQVATSTVGTFSANAASLLGQTTVQALSVDNSATATSSTASQRYSTGIYTCGATAGEVKTAKIDFTNTASGKTVTSDAFTLRCADNPYTYTASWDKASYVQGDIATLTVSFKDSKGNAANSVVTPGASTMIAPMLTAVSSTGSATTLLTNTGVKTYTWTVGTASGMTAGTYSSIIDFSSLTAVAAEKATPTYKLSTGGDTTTNADVLKSIVALIASINKQIQALQKLILKR